MNIPLNPLDKMNHLDDIEKDITLCLQSAGQAIQELSKEKSSQKNAETHTQQYIKSLANIENRLSEQITYLTQVSTGQPHEGSGYSAAKVLQMAWHRIQHARSRIRELEETKAKFTHAARQQQQQRQQQHQQQQSSSVTTSTSEEDTQAIEDPDSPSQLSSLSQMPLTPQPPTPAPESNASSCSQDTPPTLESTTT